ncbi:hypothetical protein CAPTEDRAFT_195435 [Capitella teleta]|nr:hypothetical protein CAPTEDRAFT_195435 [Capitella teleta]|eukprot:ELT91853.1 hypothetical protein CAPTEDRAFT_195435 [Capitella teleta]
MVDYVLVLVPMFLIISSNIVIIVSTVRSARQKLTLTESTEAGSSVANSTQRSLVAMLVTISVAFVVLKSPYFLVKFILPESVTKKPGFQFVSRKEAVYRFIMSFFTANMYVNNAVNFYLYMLSGREYRRELKMLVTRLCKRKTEVPVEKGNASTSTLSTSG